jgi:hypothetical protein
MSYRVDYEIAIECDECGEYLDEGDKLYCKDCFKKEKSRYERMWNDLRETVRSRKNRKTYEEYEFYRKEEAEFIFDEMLELEEKGE